MVMVSTPPPAETDSRSCSEPLQDWMSTLVTCSTAADRAR